MAWISAGTNNEELVAQLIENRVINSTKLQIAFKYTDRGDFVQPEFKSQAYLDRPFKQRYVHISAPHMYVTILEEMELKNGLSFLNIGSGSGYLSCLASCLLGDSGLTHGIDVSPEVVKHSELCCEKWFAHILKRREEGETDAPVISKEGVSFVCGNCFNIDIEKAISSCRYDRIYVGAGCPEARKEFFLSLLADDGIMIASINEKNELIKIKKTHRNVYKESHISQVIFAPLIEPTEETYELRQSPRSRLNTMTSVNSGYTSTEEQQQNTASVSGFNSIHSSPHTSSSSTWYTVNNNISDIYNNGHNNNNSSSNNHNNPPAYSLLSLSSSPMSNSVITFSTSPSLTSPLMQLATLPNTRTKKVILPPLLWAPTASRHRQFSRVFKNAVFTILLVSRHPRTAMVAVKVKGPTGGDWVVMKPCVCGTLPHPIWMYILTFTTRDWFVPRLTAYQMIQDELVVERALREAAEQRIQDEVVKRIRAERERDMYRMVVRRMSRESEVAATDSSSSNGGASNVNHTIVHDDDEDEDGEEDDNDEEEETVVAEDEDGINDDDEINDSDDNDDDDEEDDHANNMITTMDMVTDDDEEIMPTAFAVVTASATVPSAVFAATASADSPKTTTTHSADEDEISAVASDDDDDDVSIESDGNGNGDNVDDFNDSKYHIDGHDIRTVFDHDGDDDEEEEEDEQLYDDCQQQQQQQQQVDGDGNCIMNNSSMANQNALYENTRNNNDTNLHVNTTANAAGHRRKRSIIHSFEHIDFDSQSQSHSNSTTSGDNSNTSESSSNSDVDLLSPFPVLDENDGDGGDNSDGIIDGLISSSNSMNVCTGDNEDVGPTVVVACGADNSTPSYNGGNILRVSSVSGSVSMSDFTSSGLSTETEEVTTGDGSIVADKVKTNGNGNGHIAMNNHSSSSSSVSASSSSSSSSSMSVVHVAKKVANMLTPTSSFRN